MGLTVQLPAINASEWVYTALATRLKSGFMQIKGLKKEFIEAIIEERTTNGPYSSLQEFLDRVKAESAQTRLLIKVECFDSITGEVTRPRLLWRLYAREGRSHSKKGKRLPFLHASSLTPYPSSSCSDASRFTFHVLRALTTPPEYSSHQKIVCHQNNLDTGLKKIRWCSGSGC